MNDCSSIDSSVCPENNENEKLATQICKDINEIKIRGWNWVKTKMDANGNVYETMIQLLQDSEESKRSVLKAFVEENLDIDSIIDSMKD